MFIIPNVWCLSKEKTRKLLSVISISRQIMLYLLTLGVPEGTEYCISRHPRVFVLFSPRLCFVHLIDDADTSILQIYNPGTLVSFYVPVSTTRESTLVQKLVGHFITSFEIFCLFTALQPITTSRRKNSDEV
jgi:hypothetical protein